jgi:glutathione S-transferase kappa 1
MKVELFFDVGSPYSWMAMEVLLRYEHIWKMEVVLVPALVGAVHKATGNRPPGVIPAKGKVI